MAESEKIKVLYLDDEANNLIGFKALLRFDYNVFCAKKANEAFEILEKHPDIRVIFCDQRMPEKTGVEFFEEIRSTNPHPIRILITAFSDIEAVIGAINKGHVFRYVKKPWLDVDIITAIEEANKFYLAHSMLSQKNEELERAYSELDKFAYSVSHDIRGPLVGISGGINLALATNDINEVKEILKMMNKSVEKLDSFILSMHDYYSLERGELKITNINFQEIVQEIADVYNIYAKSANIKFTIDIEQNESFWNDEVSIKLIINNLLSNAFKYQIANNENKIVNLNIKVYKGEATIIVEDNGYGIEEKYQKEIFNLFFRAHHHATGSGFGLFNLKSALTKLNGKITVDSEVNKGAKFTIIIPHK
ncbi:hybrid sensor histidine kinase/response regulator [Pseudopedobacter beijingensis]|uniref:histidine kinase n=1 Tax=Pseudopedobacter beijingensis TaxID=1207056 RepID=A0ABW4I9X8_9SPHI